MLVPAPVSLDTTIGDGGEHFLLDARVRISAAPDLTGVGAWLQQALRPATGLTVALLAGADPTAEPAGQDAGRTIVIGSAPDLGPEAYRLTVRANRVQIEGGDAAGAFYGCQTLLQLLPAEIYRKAEVSGVVWAIAQVSIQDAPRFRWRGAMLDVARHFVPKHEVFRFLDLMAVHRLNTFHFHLTDDQGWRLQIDGFPALTEIGAWRTESQLGAGPDAGGDGRPHGGFYTQQDISEIVGYAAQRFITVVPEIELPGHVRALIAAYPQFGLPGAPRLVRTTWGIDPNLLNAEESTMQALLQIFDEVLRLFPSRYIGIGGDECPKHLWHADPRTQQLMAQRGLATEEQLHGWFVARISRFLAERGRRAFGWDEILEADLPPDVVVASWRGMTGAVAAAQKGHHVVACPDNHAYLDYRQSELPSEPIPVAIPLTLRAAYDFDPVPADLTAEQAQYVLGGQANIWTEHIDSARRLDYQAFPRLCAIAERLWSPSGGEFADFEQRLATHLTRLDALGIEYRRPDGPLPWQTRPGVPGRPQNVDERERHIAELVASITTG